MVLLYLFIAFLLKKNGYAYTTAPRYVIRTLHVLISFYKYIEFSIVSFYRSLKEVCIGSITLVNVGIF